jgi:peptidoglycan/xylan/chitin deacetylase (PgdA/CDA1 family)
MLKKYIRPVAQVLNMTGGWPFSPIYAGIGQILMFHRVLPEDGAKRLWANSYLEVTPEFLEGVILYYRRHGFEFLSINDFPQALGRRRQKPFVVFSFDDGFRDYLECALPVFERYEIPSVLYVVNDFPDQKIVLWWNILERIVLQYSQIEGTFLGTPFSYPSRTEDEKSHAFKNVNRLIKAISISQQEAELQRFFSGYSINCQEEIRRDGLQWEEVKQLHHHPLVTIGSHTKSHHVLSGLSEKQARKEIFGGKEKLENFLGAGVDHFAYPFGGPGEFSQRDVGLVEEAGFSTAVTTVSANIHRTHQTSPLVLPRIAVGASMGESTLDLVRHGVIPMLRNRGKIIATY